MLNPLIFSKMTQVNWWVGIPNGKVCFPYVLRILKFLPRTNVRGKIEICKLWFVGAPFVEFLLVLSLQPWILEDGGKSACGQIEAGVLR